MSDSLSSDSFPSDDGKEENSPTAVAVLDPPEVPDVHIIRDLDTLDSIEALHGLDMGTVWQLNAGQLDREASARGFGHSEGGRLLFGGTTVNLRKPIDQGSFSGYQQTSPAAEIARLHQLREKGVLTDDQFQRATNKLLGI